MFRRVLIANRGEIALRVAATCRRLGIETVVVYSEADARSLHARAGDVCVPIGGLRPAECYLDGERLIAVARAQGCDAVHPGYGFLSENPAFARAVHAAGMRFVGPTPEAMALLGDKLAARALAQHCGLPIVPGSADPLEDPEAIRAAAQAVGWPVLLKPAAGGGGKGMQVCHGESELAGALASSREVALRAFGDARVFVERYVADPRHVEVQIMADEHGQVVHLGERECSLQRRYQKVIEEAPSLAVGEILRQRMGRMACELARAAGYCGAGTVEFIFDRDAHFYFLEMNARLQVEHPVTEAICGLDLVELQLRVAAGEPLPLTQEQVELRGWAVEARICAEDPTRDFLPSTGTITRFAVPRGPGLRVDAGIAVGSPVTVWYDSLLAKVSAWAETRQAAIEALIQALNGFHVEGVVTNLDFVNGLLNHPAFQRGDFSTGFIAANSQHGELTLPPPRARLALMALVAALIQQGRDGVVRASMAPHVTRMGTTHAERTVHRYVVRSGQDRWEVELPREIEDATWEARVDGQLFKIQAPRFEFFRRRLRLGVDGQVQHFRLEWRASFLRIAFRGVVRTFEVYSPREWALVGFMPGPAEPPPENLLRCPMPGLVVRVAVAPGDRVFRGQGLVSIESMKMESQVPSPADGVVEAVLVKPGQPVETGEVLVRFGG